MDFFSDVLYIFIVLIEMFPFSLRHVRGLVLASLCPADSEREKAPKKYVPSVPQ